MSGKTRRPGFLLASAIVLAGAAFSPPASPSGGAAPELAGIFDRGSREFYRGLRLDFLTHPQRFQLTLADAQNLLPAGNGIPFLYERVIRLAYARKAPLFTLLLGKGDPGSIGEFEALFLDLSREAAGLFIQSLFEEPSLAGRSGRELHDFKESRLDLVLSGLPPAGKEPPWNDTDEGAVPEVEPSGFWGLDIIRAGSAQAVSRGAKVKIAVLDSSFAGKVGRGASPPADPPLFAPLAGFAPFARPDPGGPREPPGPFRGSVSSLVAAVAPDSDIRVFGIHRGAGAYPFWTAFQVSRGIYKAIEGGADIILVTAVFDRDFRFLKDACDYAYAKNVLVVSPNFAGPLDRAEPETPAHFPAHYNTTVAVGGVVLGARGTPVVWEASEPSHYTTCAAPAASGGGPGAAASAFSSPDNVPAAALVAGTSALISSLLPRTGEELSGQYVQRISEVLCRSCDGAALGRPGFDPRTGYGLIDADRAVRRAVPAYKEKMAQVEADFKKRAEARAAKEKRENKRD